MNPADQHRIAPRHLERSAIVYVRQSDPQQVREHTESTRLQRGLREKAIALGWPNPTLIVIVLNERHLHRLLSEFVAYYHDDRTHLGLGKGTPSMRAATSKPNDDAKIVGHPRIGGLHHRYEWCQAA